ncbi:nuclear envelope integral membrane protein 1-like isoform X2 [Denticeps clupeoides]|uniref:Nuclear envelope integral membrane protein 1 n=1 Tax=Denticeps clupeoides TaxID=299321 RepID=A0A8C4C7V4_9TELE|nr:nuclear envelope integral membrane protein 1-like isoform X2 [Denticeps clupeoides]XP_028849954.1 nuclear envelope integral membrane protein 1-like isoform X2 [Denticeps clupeoides]
MAGCTKVDAAGASRLIFLLLLLFTRLAGASRSVLTLQDGDVSEVRGSQHFCYVTSAAPGWKEAWTRIQVRVWSSAELKVTVVQDEQQLEDLEHFSVWTFVQYFIREQTNETSVNVNLFRPKTCFRVDPSQPSALYTVKPARKFDIYMFLVFLMGVALFFMANTLSRSQIFYYSAGMSTGLIASLLILIFLMARFLPKKSPFYVVIVGGWSFSLYVIQLVFRNLQLILKEHWHLAIGYAAVVGFVSFAVCYRHGPLVEERSINILSWALQLFAVVLMYAGIQVQQVALAVIAAAFCSKNLEYPVAMGFTVWRKMKRKIRWKPEPRRLLTEEEYQKQAEEETNRALVELRRFCGSPEFNTWKAVSRLQSPQRFADFMEGSPHLLPNEVSVHAQEYGLGSSFLEDELFSTDEEEEGELTEGEEGWESERSVMKSHKFGNSSS